MVAASRPSEALDPFQLRHALGLSREKMARLLDVTAKTIERWEGRRTLPTRARQVTQLAQIRDVVTLGQIVYTPEGFARFLKTPLPIFDGRTALHLLELGQAERVLAALATDYEGWGS